MILGAKRELSNATSPSVDGMSASTLPYHLIIGKRKLEQSSDCSIAKKHNCKFFEVIYYSITNSHH